MPDHSDAKRAEWPVPDHVKGFSAVDAFMWTCAQNMERFFGEPAVTTLYNDFGIHELTCGDLKLTLEWGPA